MRRIVLLGVLAGVVAGLGVAPAVSAAGPTTESEAINETFFDDFLTAECGVDVWTTATGMRTIRSFDRAKGVQQVNTVNVSYVATAGDRTFRFRDVGADVLQLANGTQTVLIIGQIPFGWTGVLKIDDLTGELVHEPHWTDTSKACRALAG